MVDATNAAGLDLAESGSSLAVGEQEPRSSPCTAFHGERIVASGEITAILPAIRAAHRADPSARLLVFEDDTGRLIDVDLREEADQARPHPGAGQAAETSRHRAGAPRAAGRPRLGVVAREVTLLPRHWEWLNRQPGGASVALRKLVDEARKTHGGRDRVRQAQEATYQFLLAIGGDLPGYEEALRALFAGRQDRFNELLEPWPADVRDHALRIARAAFSTAS